MQFISTRESQRTVTIEEALVEGLSPEGGLYVPEKLPHIDLEDWQHDKTFLAFTKSLLMLFFKGSSLAPHLATICEKALTFDIPLKKIDDSTYLLTLYHGPTLSFKDIGARFLAGCLESMRKKMTILVATSGDTGSAVASAFSGQSNVNVVILYPKGKISRRQEAQITAWEDNIKAISVEGSFDDCQLLIKSAFQDEALKKRLNLSTANSINLGRLLPQMTYFAYWSVKFYQDNNIKPGIIVPSGNLGHMTACYWAKTMGFPIGELVIATNANQTLSRYVETGEFKPKNTVSTLANAMDVSCPSNFERLSHLLGSPSAFNEAFTVMSVDDTQIKEAITAYYKKYNQFICPHTATGFYVREKLSQDTPFIIAETAHPAKFETVIEPLLSKKVPAPSRLSDIINQAKESIVIPPTLSALSVLI